MKQTMTMTKKEVVKDRTIYWIQDIYQMFTQEKECPDFYYYDDRMQLLFTLSKIDIGFLLQSNGRADMHCIYLETILLLPLPSFGWVDGLL